MSMKKINGVFLSFLVGSAIGGTIALLYAPKSGKHLRKDISRKTNDLIDEGKKLTYDTWNGAKEAAENTFETANDFLNKGVDKITHKSEKLKNAFKLGIDTFKDERSSSKTKNNLYDDDTEKIHTKIT
ncbi:MAG: YtxH domain-containing protein [Ignavibacteria bacterium]